MAETLSGGHGASGCSGATAEETRSENTCPNEAAFRYTWPGRDESFICLEHSGHMRAVAIAIGLYLQLIPIQPEQGITCRQITK